MHDLDLPTYLVRARPIISTRTRIKHNRLALWPVLSISADPRVCLARLRLGAAAAAACSAVQMDAKGDVVWVASGRVGYRVLLLSPLRL